MGKNGKLRTVYTVQNTLGSFTYIEHTDVQLRQCVICAEILSNDALKPAKLLRQFESKYKGFIGRRIDFFKRKELELKSRKKIIIKP